MTRRRRWSLAIVALVIVVCAVALWYLNSPRFGSYVRTRVIADLQRMTGGRVELGSMTWNLWRLEFEVRDLTIHGKEAPTEAPYLHVDRLAGRTKIASILRREIRLRRLELERPRVHIIVNADGTTNQPSPIAGLREEAGRLFELAIARLEITNGVVQVNERAMPLDVAADQVRTAMTYDQAAARYNGTVQVGAITTQYRDFLPVSSSVEAEFSLGATSAELKSMRWTCGRSVVVAHGGIPNFRVPVGALRYDARLDLAQVGRVAHWPQMRGGVLELKGQLVYAPEGLSSDGNLVARGVDYRDNEVRLAGADLGAQYSATRQQLHIPHLFARVWGGTVTGDADIRNWTATADQAGTARLQIRNLPVSSVTQSISTRGLPLRELRPAGTVDGVMNLRWHGPVRNAQVSVTAQVTAPSHPQADTLPIAGRVEAAYFGARGALHFTALNLSTPATHIVGSGTMGGGAENLKLILTTSNLAELEPVAEAMFGPRRLPVVLRGRATFNGSVYGRVLAPTIAGHLQATDFETVTPGATGSSATRAHWDSVTTDILYSPQMAAARNGVLRSGRAQLNFDFSAALQHGSLTDASAVSGHAAVRNAQFSDLQALAGYDYPVSGTINASLAVTGTRGNPQASARLSTADVTAYGEPVKSASADMIFSNGEAQFRNINVTHNGARVTGSGAYSPATTAFRFDLTGTNFNLARVRSVQSRRLTVGGTMNFTARASGTKNAPVIDGNIRLTGLVLNGERIGDFNVEAATSAADMRLTGRSTSSTPAARIDGNVHLRDPYPIDVTFDFANLDFNPLLLAYLQGRVTGPSSAAGKIEVRGALRRPEMMDITGSIEQLAAEVATVKIWNSGPIRFRLNEQVFRLEQLRLLGEDTSVTATGAAQLTGPQRLDFRSEGRVNLKVLQSYRPEFAAAGAITFGVNVGGVVDNPQIEGQAQIANGSVTYADLPNGLSDVNGSLLFNRDRLVVQSLTAHTGGGIVNIGGFVTYGRTLVFNLTAKASDVRLRYPPGLSSMANADLTVTGGLPNWTVAGDITVTKFGVNPQFDFAQYLARSKQPVEVAQPDSPLNNVHLDVHVTSTPELQLQTSLAKLSGDLDLRLRGTAAKPIVLGKVNIIEGDMFLNGAKYRVERGDVTFSNPVRIEPVLDVEATARVKEYDITLGFHGPLESERLKTTYRSDPPLPTADIIALLALGHTREETTAQQQQVAQPSFTQAASYAILGQALNAAVSSRVQRIFGVSRIKVDPQATSETGVASSGPQLSLEQQVNNNITLTYVTNLSQGNQQTIQLQYDVTRDVSIIAIRDDLTGVVSFDVKIRHRRK